MLANKVILPITSMYPALYLIGNNSTCAILSPLCNQVSETSLCVVHEIVLCTLFSSSILHKIREETSSFGVDEVDLYLDWLLLIGGLGRPPNVHDMNVDILSFGFG